MHYDDVIAAMFEPSPDGAMAAPTRPDSPARRLRDAIEPIAMHSVWSRSVNEAQATLGLDFMTGYVMGRASLMGRPEAGVVSAAFAVFEPNLVEGVYNAARQACDRDELWAVRTSSTIASLTDVLSGIDVTSVADALHDSLMSAPAIGRPLFGGLVSQRWPTGPIGRLWRACELIREHRGDSHILVCAASGLTAVQMNILTELWVGMPLGSYTSTRGWDPDTIDTATETLRIAGWLEGDQLTDTGRKLRDTIENTTDRLEESITASIGDGFDEVVAALEHWSQLCIEAKAFPPSVFKRAAG